MATAKAKWGYTKSGRKKKKPGRKKGQTKKYGPVYDPKLAGKKRRGRKPGSKSKAKTVKVGKERVMLEITCRKVA